jgi:hypothetical protein
MNTDILSFGQRLDPENGLVECWFTHGALDAIKEMDLSHKVVLMFGAGKGDVWLSKRCKFLHVVERSKEWLDVCVGWRENNKVENIMYHYVPVDDCSGKDSEYLKVTDIITPDVIINDDAYRFEVIEKALTLPRPLILITDNWMQDYVFYCPKGEELLKEFKHDIYPCTTHTDHSGNCWKTAIHFIQ